MDLAMAWVRRERFKAQLVAAELAALLAQAMGPDAGAANSVRTRTPVNGRYERVHADQLLGEMGITIQ